MKIAFILNEYPRITETSVLFEIQELERQGEEVQIYSLAQPDEGFRIPIHPAKVEANVMQIPEYPTASDRIRQAHTSLFNAFPETYLKLRHYAETQNSRCTLNHFLQAGVIADHLLRYPVEAIHAEMGANSAVVANFVHQLTGIAPSFIARTEDIFHDSRDSRALWRKISSARFVVTTNEFDRAYLAGISADPQADIRCLYRGVDAAHFRPFSGVHRQPNLILAVGPLEEGNGFDQLIQACCILGDKGVDFRCMIVGQGPLHRHLNLLISHRGLKDKVMLQESLLPDELLDLYRQAAVFALPHLSSNGRAGRDLPVELVEAAAAGLPIVASKLPRVVEVLDHEQSGILIEPGNTESLANALGRLLRDSRLRHKLGAAAWEKAGKDFNLHKNIAILRKWLAGPEPAPREGVVVPDFFKLPAFGAGRSPHNMFQAVYG